MTVVSEAWPARDNHPPTEIQTERDAPRHQHAPLVDAVFNRIITLATDQQRGLPRINGDIDDFDLSTVLVPRRHRPGNIREGLFNNGLWLRATTSGPLRDSLHSLILYTDGSRPYEYQVVGLDGASEPEIMVGADKIAAASPDVFIDLGSLHSTVEKEYVDRWTRQLSPMDLKIAHQTRQKSLKNN